MKKLLATVLSFALLASGSLFAAGSNMPDTAATGTPSNPDRGRDDPNDGGVSYPTDNDNDGGVGYPTDNDNEFF